MAIQRYFIEVAYKGTNYSGFQKQDNANTIQQEIENALQILLSHTIELTGSSRTDAGVHALQNFFHFDSDLDLGDKQVYNLNAILPADIWIIKFYKLSQKCHSRFDALSRKYQYHIYQKKDAFLNDRAWFFPFKVDMNLLQMAATKIMQTTNFTSFSKKHTQVNNFNCTILKSEWLQTKAGVLTYEVEANRFLRGMVKGLVGTMLLLGQGKISLSEFEGIIKREDCNNANFNPPSHGLFLMQVSYPQNYFNTLPLA